MGLEFSISCDKEECSKRLGPEDSRHRVVHRAEQKGRDLLKSRVRCPEHTGLDVSLVDIFRQKLQDECTDRKERTSPIYSD